jgi:hypothetical protein
MNDEVVRAVSLKMNESLSSTVGILKLLHVMYSLSAPRNHEGGGQEDEDDSVKARSGWMRPMLTAPI